MSEQQPTLDSAYWNELYLKSDTGWDKGEVAPPLARLASELPKGRVVVLGAGRGHDALHFAAQQFEVTAVDFAPEAVKALQLSAQQKSLRCHALQSDIFALPTLGLAPFDAVLEHTSLCAINPSRRAEYKDVVLSLLRPGGVYFGLFYAHGREGGPPFDTSESDVRALFLPAMEEVRLRRAPDSFVKRSGDELEFIFRKR